nr:hypothetical protein [Paracoccus saliphilus]
MTDSPTLLDVRNWAIQANQPADAVRSLERVPARLGMLDADLASLPSGIAEFERLVAGRGYALVGNAKDIKSNGRRMDSRIRALLRRYWASQEGFEAVPQHIRGRWSELMDLIKVHEGLPDSGSRWTIGRHRSLCGLRSRARVVPEDLTQNEVDRIGREMSADKRKSLRKAIRFLNSLRGLTNVLPDLRPFLPSVPLSPPAGSSRARPMDWSSLPEPFRTSFEAAADACLAGEDDLAERMLARIEAGEDPETVMAEADALASSMLGFVGKPTGAREQYRQAITWLLRAWEKDGGQRELLADIRELFDRATIESAIRDQIARSKAALDLRDPLASVTLKTRLTSLTTLAKRGLGDPRSVAIIRLLRTQHYDTPRKKLLKTAEGDGILMEVDRTFSHLRQKPELAKIWSNAPRRIADAARREIEAARLEQDKAREVTALRCFAGGVAYALQMSRPMRTACLRHARIGSDGKAHANLVRTSPGERLLTFRFAPWEIKNSRWVTVDVVGDDAEILLEWIDTRRPRLIELQGLDPKGIYLFPGRSLPRADAGDPVTLPRGCYAPSVFLDLWRDASAVLGVHETPHRMRHVVALLILALHPGDYALVSAVLGNEEATARAHYGRDDGQAAARESRAALLAEHPDLFTQLSRRHAHGR